MKKSIIIVLVIGVIICGGLLYLFVSKNSDSQTNQAQDLPLTAEQKTIKSTNSQKSDENYLVIKEWNVRMKLVPELDDVVIEEANDGFIGLTTAKAKSIEGCEDFSLVGIERAKKGESIGTSTVDELIDAPNKPLKKIAEYYYLNVGPVDSCVRSGKQSDEAFVSTIKTQFFDAYETLESAR